MEKKIYDIVIFGNYTKDTIVSKTGTRYVDGGGFNYGAHAAANSGKSVAADVTALQGPVRADSLRNHERTTWHFRRGLERHPAGRRRSHPDRGPAAQPDRRRRQLE